MFLTDEQVWLFHHNGFVKVAGALDSATEAEVPGDGPPPVRRLSKVVHRDPLYLEVASSPAITDPLSSILGPDIELCTNRHNHLMVRPPGSAEVYWHRDAVVWSRPIVTVLAYLDESTLENGCLEVVPGSHACPWPIAQRVETEADQARVAALLSQAVAAPMPAGGLLVTHGCLLHGSGPNRSAGPRRSLTLAYHACDEIGDAEPTEKVLVRGQRVLRHN
ncbi:MAG: phytanoyl-CoA dioxygenase family protein [Armatimonadetes bacterium]|nr:phytanoyl-CoA dioxygenase family protein [Armatimonadota bacterium]